MGFRSGTKYGESRDKGYHMDLVAWYCNALGASGDKKYYTLLGKVNKEATEKKIKKYASTNMALLN
jgi:hypothetical protein